jgi:hypothetical protein
MGEDEGYDAVLVGGVCSVCSVWCGREGEGTEIGTGKGRGEGPDLTPGFEGRRWKEGEVTSSIASSSEVFVQSPHRTQPNPESQRRSTITITEHVPPLQLAK